MLRSRFTLSLPRGRAAGRWAAAAYFGAVSIAFFWSTFASTNTVITGPYRDGDNFWHVWQIWTFHRAMLNGSDPAYTDRIYALIPGGVPIFVENWLSEFVGALISGVTTPLIAYNFLLWSSFFLGGITTYALAGEFTRHWLARVMAGSLFTFSTYHFWRAAGHLGEVTIEFMPLYAWRLIAFIRRPSLANAAWVALTFAAVPLSEVYYGPYFDYPFTLFTLGALLIANRAWFSRRNALLGCAALCGGMILTIIPLRSFLQVPPDVRALVASYAQSSLDPLSADAATLVLPNASNPFLGAIGASVYAHLPSPYPVEQAAYLGWIALLFALGAVVFMRRERWLWFWGGITALGVVLALGPHLHIGGRDILPLPFYSVLYHWPILSNFRAPNRLIVLGQLGLSILAALGAAALLQRAERFSQRAQMAARVFIAVCMLGSIAESMTWSLPLPVAPAVVPWPYYAIGQLSGDDALLELPLTNAASEQYAQTVHGKRLVGGFTSRVTPRMSASIDVLGLTPQFSLDPTSPIALAGARSGDPMVTADIRATLRSHDVRYVALHDDQLDPDSQRWAHAFLEKALGKPRFADGGPVSIWQVW